MFLWGLLLVSVNQVQRYEIFPCFPNYLQEKRKIGEKSCISLSPIKEAIDVMTIHAKRGTWKTITLEDGGSVKIVFWEIIW